MIEARMTGVCSSTLRQEENGKGNSPRFCVCCLAAQRRVVGEYPADCRFPERNAERCYEFIWIQNMKS